MLRARLALLLPALAACSEKTDEPPRPTVATMAPAPADAPAPPSDGITSIGTYDPDSGMHVDDDVPPAAPPPPSQRAAGHPKPIDVVLKSSPPGAMAAVDGVQIGQTPTYWIGGEADGREHEFTFVLRGYAAARYRFVPIASGVIHARLEAIAEDRPADGGAAPR